MHSQSNTLEYPSQKTYTRLHPETKTKHIDGEPVLDLPFPAGFTSQHSCKDEPQSDLLHWAVDPVANTQK